MKTFNECISFLRERVIISYDKEEVKQPWDGQRKDLIRLYKSQQSLLFAVRDKLFKGLKTTTRKVRHPKILVGIKSLESFLDKVVFRKYSPNKITDVVRSAVLVNTENDINVVKKAIIRKFKVIEYEIKEDGEDKEFGYYGSHHFLVEIDSVLVEIQVMTRRLWAYKEEAHKIYDKYRSSDKIVDRSVEVADKKLSKRIFNAGNRKSN